MRYTTRSDSVDLDDVINLLYSLELSVLFRLLSCGSWFVSIYTIFVSPKPPSAERESHIVPIFATDLLEDAARVQYLEQQIADPSVAAPERSTKFDGEVACRANTRCYGHDRALDIALFESDAYQQYQPGPRTSVPE